MVKLSEFACPKCMATSSIEHTHDISNAHIPGSERYECKKCNHKLTVSERKNLDLKYWWD